MKLTYKRDREWADSHLGQVEQILKDNMSSLVVVDTAPDAVDCKNATDMVIALTGGDVAVRLRRWNCKYRDLTIRSHRDTGARTELSKIRDGFCNWYLYGWLNKLGRITEWILVDLGKLRSSGLLEGQRQISNHDGTYFIAISIPNLIQHDCIVVKEGIATP